MDEGRSTFPGMMDVEWLDVSEWKEDGCLEDRECSGG